MKENINTLSARYEKLNCLGHYNNVNPLCSGHCAIRLRCVIQQNQNIRMEILEDLIAEDETLVKIQ